jgi:hypothetical protein
MNDFYFIVASFSDAESEYHISCVHTANSSLGGIWKEPVKTALNAGVQNISKNLGATQNDWALQR